MGKKIIMILFWALMVIHICSAGEFTVFVSIMPQKYIIDEISGGKINTEVMVRPGFSPATYEPLPSQMEKLNSAALFFTAEMPFEEIWMPVVRKRYPELNIRNMTAGIVKDPMDNVEELLSEHPGEHGHHGHHEALDPHVWLDPILFISMGENALQGLQEMDPDNSVFYRENFFRFRKRIMELHKEVESLISVSNIRILAVFHPSWGYFARRYGLKQIPVEVSGKSPSPRELEKIIAYLKSQNIRRVFIQKEFSVHAAEYIANRLKGKVIVLSPLEYDYPAGILKTVMAITGGRYD